MANIFLKIKKDHPSTRLQYAKGGVVTKKGPGRPKKVGVSKFVTSLPNGLQAQLRKHCRDGNMPINYFVELALRSRLDKLPKKQ